MWGAGAWCRMLGKGWVLTLVQGGMVMLRWQSVCCRSSYFMALRRNESEPLASRLLSRTCMTGHSWLDRGAGGHPPPTPPSVAEVATHLDRQGQPVLPERLEEEAALLRRLLDWHQVP